ncbi:MAG: energy transducer TonB [Thermoanaerobaculia bacterium]
MRLKRITPLLPFLFALAAPLAAQAPSPPPAQPPLMLGGVEPLMSRQKEVLDLLLAKKWEKAREAAKLQFVLLAGYVDQYPGLAATALALEALADAGAGDRDQALCRWKVAQALDPKLVNADLSAFGAAGELLRSQPAETEEPKAAAQDGAEKPVKVGGEVTRPEIITHSAPLYPEAARRAKVTGTVVVESIIDKDGSVKNVRTLKDQPMGLGLSAMEAACAWRFKPAALDHKPVKVYYVLTINFDVQKGPPPPISNP